MRITSVKIRAALIYLFLGMLVYLAGVYVDPVYYYLYIFLSLLPVFSVLQVVLSLTSLKCRQVLDTDHPVKGSTIGYHVQIRVNAFLAAGCVRVRFAPIHPRLPDRIPDITLALRARGTIDEYYSVHCRYRGTYTIGIQWLEITDALGWLTLRKPSSSRSFHVYPRITTITSPPAATGSRLLSTARVGGSGETDFGTFSGLEGYREGMSVRHISWKKFLATGLPFLKHFDTRARQGLRLVVDLRRFGDDPARELEIEDCSIETAVALVKASLSGGVPIGILAHAERPYRFEAAGLSAFEEFYRSTVELEFRPHAPSPLELLGRQIDEGPILILTHVPDPAILELLDERSGSNVSVILTLVGLSEVARERVASNTNGRLFLVERADSLEEDSHRWQPRLS